MYVQYLLDATDAHQIINTQKQNQNDIQYKAEQLNTILLDKAMQTTEKEIFLMNIGEIFRLSQCLCLCLDNKSQTQ